MYERTWTRHRAADVTRDHLRTMGAGCAVGANHDQRDVLRELFRESRGCDARVSLPELAELLRDVTGEAPDELLQELQELRGGNHDGDPWTGSEAELIAAGYRIAESVEELDR